MVTRIFLFLILFPCSLQGSLVEELEESFIQAFEIVSPSVVSISTVQILSRQNDDENPYGFNDALLNDFIRRYIPFIPESKIRQYGLGSGIIVAEDGYILTNEHVIRDADDIHVTLYDGSKFKAQLVGLDKRSDLAVIKIDKKDLRVAQLGDSDALKVGQWVLALGNPFGFLGSFPTMTSGIVSAVKRKLPGLGLGTGPYYFDLVQTDAAIHPGNSGGPLVNLKGEVIGINMAVFTTLGGYHGLGFAIPINIAKIRLSQMLGGEKISYGSLGLGVGPVDPKRISDLKIPSAKGAYVTHVIEGGLAQKQGLREGDVIWRLGGRDIETPQDLIEGMQETQMGISLEIEFYRRGQLQKIQIDMQKTGEGIKKE